jgi:methylated-DNA-[protein]-cysteine S-methyltransferase
MRFCYLESPIGRLMLAGDERGLHVIEFLASPRARSPEPEWTENPSAFDRAAAELREYFAGERRRFTLKLAPQGTPFQQRVWTALRDIPYGETCSYGELASRIGQPAASRAVGLANGRNPLPIVIPCHRVIGANGSLTGYGGGLPIKRHLLALEGVGVGPLPL